MPISRRPARSGPPTRTTWPSWIRSPTASTTTRPTARPAPGLSRFEFAVACAVVGVLLAVLLGTLSHWRGDARRLRLDAAIAAVQRAVPLFQAHCMRSADPRCEQLLIDGEAIAGAHGHAAAAPQGIARLAALPPDTRLRPGTQHGVPALTIDVAPDASVPCTFTYVQAPHAGVAPGIDPSSISCP